MQTQTILVTGGTGYVGAWIVKGLLDKSYTVRLTVRDKNNEKKFETLRQIALTTKGKLEIWEAGQQAQQPSQRPKKL